MNKKLITSFSVIFIIAVIANIYLWKSSKNIPSGINVRETNMTPAKPEQAEYLTEFTEKLLSKLKQKDYESIIAPISSDLTPYQLNDLNEKFDKICEQEISINRVLSEKAPKPSLWEVECLLPDNSTLYFRYHLSPENGLRLANVY